MNSINKVLTTIFIWSFIGFLSGLTNKFFNNEILFWIFLLLMIFIVFYQIFRLDKINSFIILCEIFVIGLSLHLIYQYGYYGLRGSDAYFDYDLFKTILITHHFMITAGNIAGWPMLHLLSSAISIIGNINSLSIAKYFPSFLTSFIIFPIYLLVKELYKDERIALLSGVIFVTIPQFVNFESLFVCESMGVLILLFTFYFLYISKNRDSRFSLLFLLSAVTLIFSHHFTSMIGLVLMGVYLIVDHLIYRRRNKVSNSLTTKRDLNTVFLVFAVMLFSYWVYSAVIIWQNVGDYINVITGLNEMTAYVSQVGATGSIVTLKGNIIFYGFMFFNLFFALVMILKVFIDKNKKFLTEDITFIFIYIFCGIYGFLALYLIEPLISPDRVLTFAWVFAIIPISGFLLTLKKYKSIYQKIFIGILLFFIIFNVYNIDSNYINQNFNLLGLANDKEYAIADNFQFPDSYSSNNSSEIYYFGYGGVIGAIYDKQGILPRYVGIDTLSIKYYEKDLGNSSRIAIINEPYLSQDLEIKKIKSKEIYNETITILSFKDERNVNRIADIGNGLYVLKGGF